MALTSPLAIENVSVRHFHHILHDLLAVKQTLLAGLFTRDGIDARALRIEGNGPVAFGSKFKGQGSTYAGTVING